MDMANIKLNNETNNKRTYKGRGVAAPSIPKAGITRKRRRLEYGGKITDKLT